MSIGDIGIGSGLGIGESYVVTSKTYTVDYLLSLPTNGYYAMDVFVTKVSSKTFDIDQLLTKNVPLGTLFDAYFLRTRSLYEMDVKFISDYRNRMPVDSIINSLYWSWATVLDQSYRDIVNACHSMNIARADTTDLDTIGEVYHLRRLVNEEDEHYRKRLFTQTNVLIGHGTKSVCEGIIEQVIGIVGCSIVTGAPSTIRIEFDNYDAMRAAKLYRDTLEEIIPNMVAAGIYWELYTTLIDYTMTLPILGDDTCPYTMDVLNEDSHSVTYDLDILNVLHLTKTVTMDILQNRMLYKVYEITSYIRDTNTFTFMMDMLNKKSNTKQYVMICPNKKRNIQKTFVMDSNILRNNILSVIIMDMLSEKSRRLHYSVRMTVV